MPEVESVLIVGGGIAGLALARALRNHGFAVELVERNPVWRAAGGGIAVQPNAMRVLRGLGLDGAVEREGVRLCRWSFCDAGGEILSETDLDALWGDVGPFVGIERLRLQQILVDGAAGARCRLGMSIRSLRQHAERVSVVFSDGSSGNYDLVVGADGIASSVRGLIFGEISPAYSGAMAWRSVAPIRPQGLADLRFLLGEGCFFGLCPIAGGATYGFGNIIGPRAHEPMAGRRDRLRRRFAGFGEIVQQYLAAIGRDEEIHCGPVECVALAEWGSGRVILIGDAAHASSPMMGQGGSMAIEDAQVLAESLRQYPTLAAAREAFAGRRQPRVGWVQQESEAVAQGFRLPPAIRDEALRRHGAAALRRRFAPLVAAP